MGTAAGEGFAHDPHPLPRLALMLLGHAQDEALCTVGQPYPFLANVETGSPATTPGVVRTHHETRIVQYVRGGASGRTPAVGSTIFAVNPTTYPSFSNSSTTAAVGVPFSGPMRCGTR